MIKPELIRLEMNGAVKGEDFKVITKLLMTKDLQLVPFGEDIDKDSVMATVETPYDEKVVKYSYHLEDHKIDKKLASIIGLGVLVNIHIGDEFLYNSGSDEDESEEDIQAQELLRLGIYYQINYPEYFDTKLYTLLFNTKGGEEYIRSLFIVQDDEPINKLKEILNKHQKNRGNNIVQFPKK